MSKVNKKIWLLIPILAFVSGLVIGCGGEDGGGRNHNPYPTYPNYPGGGAYVGGQYGYGTSWGTDNLQITNKSIYKDFLAGSGICERPGQYYWTVDVGGYHTSNCDNWDSNPAFELNAYGNTAPAQAAVTFWASEDNSWLYDSQYPVSYNGELYKTNNNTALEFRKTGHFGTVGYNDTLRLIFEGDLDRDDLLVRAYWNNQEFARTRIYRRY